MSLGDHYARHIFRFATKVNFVFWCGGRRVQLMVSWYPEDMFEMLFGRLKSFIECFERFAYYIFRQTLKATF